MRSTIVVVFLNFILSIDINTHVYSSSTCGRDSSPVQTVYEGIADVKNYPWMGLLYYPMDKKRFTTSVVLVTRQIVIAAANEIEKLPKWDFRARARVVLGRQCGRNNENGIKLRDYTYHPEFNSSSLSALAMLQLDVDHVKQELIPICPPPTHFITPRFFAITMSKGCKNPKVQIHRMQYVNIDRCKNFYRKSGLSQDSIWPTHTACARALSGGKCLWRSGSVLAIKQDGQWRMMGFSIYGPGCGAPARFIDYGIYQKWVWKTSSSMGRPAITRLGDNHIVMRRSSSSIQRFGICDSEETRTQLYSDKIDLVATQGIFRAKYNLSLYANVDYSCIIFKAKELTLDDYKELGHTPLPPDTIVSFLEPRGVPKIRLRRWCASPTAMCFGFQYLEIQFFVEIQFSQAAEFTVQAFGKEAQIIAPNIAFRYSIRNQHFPGVLKYTIIMDGLRDWKSSRRCLWFYVDDVESQTNLQVDLNVEKEE